MPFEYRDYHSPYVQTIAQLMTQAQQAEADRRVQLAAIQSRSLENAALIRGRAIGNIGEIAVGAGQAIARDRREAPLREMQTLQLGQARQELIDNNLLRQAIGMGAEGPKFLQSLGQSGVGASMKYAAYQQGQAELAQKQQTLRDQQLAKFGAILAQPGEGLTKWRSVRDEVGANKLLSPAQLQAVDMAAVEDPDLVTTLGKQWLSRTVEGLKLLTDIHETRPGATGTNPLTGEVRASVPATPRAVSRVDLAIRAAQGDQDAQAALDKLTTERQGTSQEKNKLVEVAPGKWTQMQLSYVPGVGTAGKWFNAVGEDVSHLNMKDVPSAGTVVRVEERQRKDALVKKLAKAVEGGTLAPSQVGARGGNRDEVVAEVLENNPKFNVQQAEQAYLAANQWVRSMNSQRMIQFRRLASSAMPLIDRVIELGNELEQGNVELFNKVTRGTAEKVFGNTEYGKLARRYETAVGALATELAGIESGGFAPTSDAWEQVRKQININAGAPALADQLETVRYVLKARLNAPIEPEGTAGPVTTASGGRVGIVETPKPEKSDSVGDLLKRLFPPKPKG